MVRPMPPTPDAPRTYLAWSIASTCLCFLPLGLVAVAYALRSASFITAGDLDAAARSARIARRWLITTVVVGVVIDLVLVTALALLGAFGSQAGQ